MFKDRIVRDILTGIDDEPSVSQRKLSEHVGVSVGMVNWHIKRCVKKGYIKVQQAPFKRYKYYLTPEGFVEKAKLTTDYLKHSFDIFKTGRKQYQELFDFCIEHEFSNIAFLGDSELANLAMMVCSDNNYKKPLFVIDFHSQEKEACGVPLISSYEDLNRIMDKVGKVEAVIVTSFDVNPAMGFDDGEFCKNLDIDKFCLLYPDFLC